MSLICIWSNSLSDILYLGFKCRSCKTNVNTIFRFLVKMKQTFPLKVWNTYLKRRFSVKMLRRCAGRIYIALIISGFFVYTHQWTLFERCTCNDGYSCHPDDLVFEARYKNFTGCAAHCRRSADCFELFYDPLQFFCFGCNMIRGPVLGTNTGLKYYQRRGTLKYI